MTTLLDTIVYSQNSVAIEWSITGVRTRNQSTRDIVVELDWTMKGTQLKSDLSPLTASQSGTIQLDYDPTKFTDFANLTQAQLIAWVNKHLGLDTINGLRKIITNGIVSQTLTSQTVPAFYTG